MRATEDILCGWGEYFLLLFVFLLILIVASLKGLGHCSVIFLCLIKTFSLFLFFMIFYLVRCQILASFDL